MFGGKKLCVLVFVSLKQDLFNTTCVVEDKVRRFGCFGKYKQSLYEVADSFQKLVVILFEFLLPAQKFVITFIRQGRCAELYHYGTKKQSIERAFADVLEIMLCVLKGRRDGVCWCTKALCQHIERKHQQIVSEPVDIGQKVCGNASILEFQNIPLWLRA